MSHRRGTSLTGCRSRSVPRPASCRLTSGRETRSAALARELAARAALTSTCPSPTRSLGRRRAIDPSTTLLATLAAGPHGGTVVRADAEVVWYPPRTAAEYLDPMEYQSVTITACAGQ